MENLSKLIRLLSSYTGAGQRSYRTGAMEGGLTLESEVLPPCIPGPTPRALLF